MIRESLAILVVGILLAITFLRSRHYGYMLASLPVFLIPIAHLLIRGILFMTAGRFFGVRVPVVTAFADLLGLVVAGVCIGFFAQRITYKRTRYLYLAVMFIFSILLGWVYIFNSISVLLF